MEMVQAADRHERRTRFQLALEKLKKEFPLEQRIMNAAAEIQIAYVRVLRHWLEALTAPASDLVPAGVLNTLAAMDAVIVEGPVLGCYPFSARDRGIMVRLGGAGVRATCALDALAIPRLAHKVSRVTARCAVCRCHLAIEVQMRGSVEDGSREGTRVVWHPSRQTGAPCCNTLCSSIRFLCKYCGVPAGAESYTLPEAAALANRFFAFQARLSKLYPAVPARQGRAGFLHADT